MSGSRPQTASNERLSRRAGSCTFLFGKESIEYSDSRLELILFDSLNESTGIDSFCKKIGFSIR